MSDNRARIWFASFILVVFCLGGVVGYRVVPPFIGDGRPLARPGPDDLGFGPPGPRRGGPGRGGGPPPFGRGPGGPALPGPELVNRLAAELQLDAAQHDQVRKILDDRRDRFEAVHREARERFDKEQRDLHTAIRAVLRPEQQTRFDQFLDRRR